VKFLRFGSKGSMRSMGSKGWKRFLLAPVSKPVSTRVFSQGLGDTRGWEEGLKIFNPYCAFSSADVGVFTNHQSRCNG
jgi:hypothetical protein